MGGQPAVTNSPLFSNSLQPNNRLAPERWSLWAMMVSCGPESGTVVAVVAMDRDPHRPSESKSRLSNSGPFTKLILQHSHILAGFSSRLWTRAVQCNAAKTDARTDVLRHSRVYYFTRAYGSRLFPFQLISISTSGRES